MTTGYVTGPVTPVLVGNVHVDPVRQAAVGDVVSVIRPVAPGAIGPLPLVANVGTAGTGVVPAVPRTAPGVPTPPVSGTANVVDAAVTCQPGAVPVASSTVYVSSAAVG